MVSERAEFGPETCAWCYGSGARPEGRCPVCRGKGAVMVRQPARVCPACACAGREPDSPAKACPACRGSGWEGADLPRESVTGDNVREMFERFYRGG